MQHSFLTGCLCVYIMSMMLAAVQTLPQLSNPHELHLRSHRHRFRPEGKLNSIMHRTACCSAVTMPALLNSRCLSQQLKAGPGDGWSQRSLLFDIIRCSGMNGNRTLNPKTATHLVVENPALRSEKLDAARKCAVTLLAEACRLSRAHQYVWSAR